MYNQNRDVKNMILQGIKEETNFSDLYNKEQLGHKIISNDSKCGKISKFGKTIHVYCSRKQCCSKHGICGGVKGVKTDWCSNHDCNSSAKSNMALCRQINGEIYTAKMFKRSFKDVYNSKYHGQTDGNYDGDD